METLGALRATEQRGAIDALGLPPPLQLEQTAARLGGAAGGGIGAARYGGGTSHRQRRRGLGLGARPSSSAVERFSDSKQSAHGRPGAHPGRPGQDAGAQRRPARLPRGPGAGDLDLSILSQKRMVDDLQELPARQAAPGRRSLTMDHGRNPQAHRAWAVSATHGGAAGAFVIILVGVLGVQLDLVSSLGPRRQVEEQRRQALEKEPWPPGLGRVTFADGRIGISGSVLFPSIPDQLQPEGRHPEDLWQRRWPPTWAPGREMLMVSGSNRRPSGAGQQPAVRRQPELFGAAGADRDAGP